MADVTVGFRFRIIPQNRSLEVALVGVGDFAGGHRELHRLRDAFVPLFGKRYVDSQRESHFYNLAAYFEGHSRAQALHVVKVNPLVTLLLYVEEASDEVLSMV